MFRKVTKAQGIYPLCFLCIYNGKNNHVIIDSYKFDNRNSHEYYSLKIPI